MELPIDLTGLTTLWRSLEQWLFAEVVTWTSAAQFGVVLALVGVASLAGSPVRRFADHLQTRFTRSTLLATARALEALAFPISAALLLWFADWFARQQQWPSYFIGVVASLVTAWAVIRLLARLAPETVWTRLIATGIWTVVALNIVGLLNPLVEFLDSVAIKLGAVNISALGIIKAVIALAVLMWIALLLSRVLERRINSLTELTPSVQVLLIKLTKFVLIAVAGIMALTSVGIDFTTFALFTGAIGVGIGFGLQKIIANFISGLILLLDKSIKPGDVIEINETYGRIDSLGARYVSVITRDSMEVLIPNEDLITQQVVNWSFSNNLVRLKLTIGIHYQSDVRKAIQLCLDAAANTDRILSDPKPNCFIIAFNDSSVDLSLRIWINDPMSGVSNVRGAVLLAVWDRFHEHGIEIPYPQRDLHIKSSSGLDLNSVMPEKA